MILERISRDDAIHSLVLFLSSIEEALRLEQHQRTCLRTNRKQSSVRWRFYRSERERLSHTIDAQVLRLDIVPTR